MCSRWIENNTTLSSLDDNNISLAQKILEILALNPKITLQELAIRTEESEKNVKNVIRQCSPFPNYQPYSFLVYDDEYFDVNTLTDGLLDFMQHIVIVRQNPDGNNTYY